MRFKTFWQSNETREAVHKTINNLSYDQVFKKLEKYDMMDWYSYFDDLDIVKFQKRLEPIPYQECDYIIFIGTGGSFQGLEAIAHFFNQSHWLFLGSSLDKRELDNLKLKIKGSKIGFNIISKTATTLEILLMIDLFYQEISQSLFINVVSSYDFLYQKVKSQFDGVPVNSFHIQEKTGGRFSLMGEMGLLAFFLAGADLNLAVESFKSEKQKLLNNFFSYTGLLRGTQRYYYQSCKNYLLEVLSTNERAISPLLAWSRQLFAESDGKNEKGMYISLAYYPKDAHSIGQIFVQGKKIAIETFILFENDSKVPLSINQNSYSQIPLSKIGNLNKYFIESIIQDRVETNIPVSVYYLKEGCVKDFSAYIFSESISILVECFLLDVNPFDQPGVEGYKKKIKTAIYSQEQDKIN